MTKAFKTLAWLALALALTACAGTPQTDRLMSGTPAAALGDSTRGEPALPVRVELTDVPFFPQEDYYCGPAALATVLTWGGLPTTQEQLADIVYTPGRKGTLRSDVIGAARRFGRLAVTVDTLPELLREIAAGHPVIVFQNLALPWYAQWHFAVAVGYDLDTGDIILRSGLDERHVTRLSTFEHTWRRGDYWALAVLPPEELPATADETAVLAAAAGIERAGPPENAASAYGAILSRWPDSYGAWIGTGNVRYAAGDMNGAAAAFQQAAALRPNDGASWNNLAVVLDKMGKRAAATAAARKAIAIGGPYKQEYLKTLSEIEKQQI